MKSGPKLCAVGKPELYLACSRPLGVYKTNVLVLDPLDLTRTLPRTSARLSLVWADTPLTDHLVTCLNRPLLRVRQSLTSLRPKAGAINRFTCSKFTTDKLDSLMDVLEECYDLSNIRAAGLVNSNLGTVLFVFETKNKKGNVLYYLWNGLEDTVWHFVQETLLNIKNEIRQQGTMDTRGR